ncbi:MAG TPA: DUF1761 domain-containing protein [Gemmatales bacterium]|nr:DUF1761 domain-containing protein [Gemmatales bacterium]
MPFSLPWLLILAAAVLYFVLGAFWYGYFGEAWLRELGKTREHVKGKDPSPFVLAFVGAFLNATAVAIVLQWVAPLTETRLLAAFVTTLLLAGAVLAASSAKHYAFSGWSWKLFAIDLGHDATGFFLMSLLIVLLR